MNKPLKITLITLAIIVGVPLFVLCGYAFFFADFFSSPSEKECVKTAEQFLGCRLGRNYEIMDYDADFSHPDRQLNFSIKLPPNRFQKVMAFCEKEVKKEAGVIQARDGKYDVITSPIYQTNNGFMKTEEVLWGEDRVHFQRLDVLLDEGIIEFVGMSY